LDPPCFYVEKCGILYKIMQLKNKKVLLMGLGVLGGGVATAKWLLKQGAELTITDMKDEEALTPSLLKLRDFKK
jgi:UDP-N-acetylmuramoylalanine--D-glutamate ligase